MFEGICKPRFSLSNTYCFAFIYILYIRTSALSFSSLLSVFFSAKVSKSLLSPQRIGLGLNILSGLFSFAVCIPNTKNGMERSVSLGECKY